MTVIAYSFVAGDILHVGHLKLLKKAKEISSYHICGVLSSEAIQSYKRKPIMSYEERSAIISELRCVDMIMKQDSKNPMDNLKKIHRDFPYIELICVHGSDWKRSEFPSEEELKRINCRLELIPYYKPLSTTKLLKKIIARDKKGDLNL